MNMKVKQFFLDMPTSMMSRTKIKIQFADGYNYLHYAKDFHSAIQFALKELWCIGSSIIPVWDIRQKILDTRDEDLYNEFIEEVDNLTKAFENLSFIKEKI